MVLFLQVRIEVWMFCFCLANDCFGTLIEGLAAPVSRDLECLIALVVRQLSAPTIPSAQRARSLLTLTRKVSCR